MQNAPVYSTSKLCLIGAVSSVKADVRIITATNKKLDQLPKQCKFREDLYYRINVMKLELPPLRDRKEDIPLLVEHFISRFNRLHDKNICCATNEVTATLMAYAIVAVTALMGFTGHTIAGDFNFMWTVPMVCVAVAGGLLGGKISIKTNAAKLQKIFAYNISLQEFFLGRFPANYFKIVFDKEFFLTSPRFNCVRA